MNKRKRDTNNLIDSLKASSAIMHMDKDKELEMEIAEELMEASIKLQSFENLLDEFWKMESYGEIKRRLREFSKKK